MYRESTLDDNLIKGSQFECTEEYNNYTSIAFNSSESDNDWEMRNDRFWHKLLDMAEQSAPHCKSLQVSWTPTPKRLVGCVKSIIIKAPAQDHLGMMHV